MKRFILVSVLLSCILLFCGSVSYATLQMGNFTQFNYNGTIVDFFDSLLMRAFQVNDLDSLSPNRTSDATNLSSLYSYLEGTTYNFFYFRLTNNYTYLNEGNGQVNYMTVQVSPNEFNSGRRILNLSRQKSDGSYNCSDSSSSGSTTIKGDYDYPSTWDKYLVIKNGNTWTFYSGQNNQNNNPSVSLKYISNKNDLMSINMGNSNQSFIKANYNLNGWINIGYLQNYDTYNELQGYLAVYSGRSNVDSANYYDTIANFQYNKSINQQYTSNMRIDYDNGNIYINSLVCSYNHGYSLYFTGNGIDTTDVKYYYFVPLDSSASSGDINTDNPTNLDFDFINSVEYISQSPSGNVGYIINSIFSGDINSGDIVSSLGYIDPTDSNTQYGYIHNIFNGVIDTLLSSDDNVTFTINVHGYNRTFNSSDFTTPSSPIKTFATLFLIARHYSITFSTIYSYLFVN